MTNDIHRLINTQSALETESLGKKIGSYFKGGEVIELISD